MAAAASPQEFMSLTPDIERYEMRSEDVEEFYSRRPRVAGKQTKTESKRCNHCLRSTRGPRRNSCTADEMTTRTQKYTPHGKL
jgi:hypothetical protein